MSDVTPETRSIVGLVLRDMPQDMPQDPADPEIEGAPPAAPPARRSVFVASTGSEDRMGDIVDQSWILDRYEANPVVLWAHRSDLAPVGRAAVKLDGGRLVCSILWDEASECGAEVARQVREGFLSAVSVGFRSGVPIARRTLPEDDPRYSDKYGVLFTQNELLEISVVPVPANQDALVISRSATVSAAEVVRCVRAGLPAPGELGAIVDAVVAQVRSEIPRPVQAADVVAGLAGSRAFVDAVVAGMALQELAPPPEAKETEKALDWWDAPETRDADWWDAS